MVEFWFGINERRKYGDIRGHFVIPAEIGGQIVTGIGRSAFAYDCLGLISLEIPIGVISIGANAFAHCRGLTRIQIPYGVIKIDEFAFYCCHELTSIEIPNGVLSIGKSAFEECRGLSSITIPNGVTSMGARAFLNCYRLSSIDIPNSVIRIGVSAFYGCSGLDAMQFSLPMRKLFPYKWVNALNLSSTFEYVFEFLSWQDFARMTKVSKYFYSNVMVRCRKDFMYNRIGETNVVIESDRPEELSIIGSAQCVSLFGRDELALYSSYCSGVRSVCVPPSFQEAAPAVVEVGKK